MIRSQIRIFLEYIQITKYDSLKERFPPGEDILYIGNKLSSVPFAMPTN